MVSCDRGLAATSYFILFSWQVGTHADSLIAEAVLKNITGFDRELAWEAVWKDATVPPEKDLEVV